MKKIFFLMIGLPSLLAACQSDDTGLSVIGPEVDSQTTIAERSGGYAIDFAVVFVQENVDKVVLTLGEKEYPMNLYSGGSTYHWSTTNPCILPKGDNILATFTLFAKSGKTVVKTATFNNHACH